MFDLKMELLHTHRKNCQPYSLWIQSNATFIYDRNKHRIYGRFRLFHFLRCHSYVRENFFWGGGMEEVWRKQSSNIMNGPNQWIDPYGMWESYAEDTRAIVRCCDCAALSIVIRYSPQTKQCQITRVWLSINGVHIDGVKNDGHRGEVGLKISKWTSFMDS